MSEEIRENDTLYRTIKLHTTSFVLGLILGAGVMSMWWWLFAG